MRHFNKISQMGVLLLMIGALALASCSSLDKAEALYEEGQREKALEMAASYLDSDEAPERIRALRLLGKIGGKKAGKLASPLLQDPNYDVQVAATKQVGKLRHEPASEQLVSMVLASNGELFDALAKAVRQIGETPIDMLMEEYTTTRQSSDKAVYKKMLIAVGPAVTGAVTRSLHGKSYFENRDHFDILVALKSPSVAKLMLQYIGDEEVARFVVEGLTQLGSLAVDAVVAELEKQTSENGNPLVRERLIKTLGQLKDPRATVVLEQLSQDENMLVRQAVDRALFQIRGF